MSIFNFWRKNSVTRIEFNNLFEWFKYRLSSGGSVSEQEAVEVTAVLCAVRVLGEGVAQMPISIRQYQFDDKGRPKHPAIRDHWLMGVLGWKPNDWMTPYEFQEFAVMIAALFGDFVAVKNGPTRGRNAKTVKELLPLVPGSWSVKQENDFSLVYEVNLQNGQKLHLKREQVFHLRGPSLDSVQGVKPVQLAKEAIGLNKSLEKTQANLAANGGRPSGVLSSENKLRPEQAEMIKKTWTDKFGSSGEGGVAVLDGGWKFSTMTMTAVDAQHIETRRFQIEEIARLFRVNPQMLMSTDKTATFASAESFFRNHVIHSLGPWAMRYEQAVNRDLLANENERVFCDLDERSLLKGDFKDQSDYYSKALGSGGTPAWMTQNDVRVEVGLEPSEDEQADKLFNGFQQDQEAPDAETN